MLKITANQVISQYEQLTRQRDDTGTGTCLEYHVRDYPLSKRKQ